MNKKIKTIGAALLAAAMCVSFVGCSGVSEESYNSVVAENESLKSEKSALESENSKLTSEKAELQTKAESLEKQNSDNEALIEELQGNSVPLEIVDSLLKTFVHTKNEIYDASLTENVQQYIYTDMSACHILSSSVYLSPKAFASVLKGQEETLKNVSAIGASSYAFLFKSYDHKNVACYWYANNKSGWIWFDKDVEAEYEML